MGFGNKHFHLYWGMLQSTRITVMQTDFKELTQTEQQTRRDLYNFTNINIYNPCE